MSSQAAARPENVVGGVIFIFYIISALVLLSWLTISLTRTYLQKTPAFDTRQTRQVQIFSSLAVVSFSTLSYHMLNVLISSYISWASFSGYPLPQVMSWQSLYDLRLWEWARTSTLFQDFASSICTKANGNWWWTGHVLIFTMAWNIFMAIEGSARNTQLLWMYFALDQILPVSLTMNLFLLSTIIEPPHDQVSTRTSLLSAPKTFHQLLLLSIYFTLILAAPSAVGTPLLIPIVLLTRMLLFYPYLGFRIHSPPIINSAVHQKLKKVESLWTVLKPTMASMTFGYGISWVSSLANMTTRSNSWATLTALFNDSAISALGFDFLLALLSAVLWLSLSRGKAKPPRG